MPGGGEFITLEVTYPLALEVMGGEGLMTLGLPLDHHLQPRLGRRPRGHAPVVPTRDQVETGDRSMEGQGGVHRRVQARGPQRH